MSDANAAAPPHGQVPEGVATIAYAPRASAAIAECVGGAAAEIMLDGPRGSGKSQAVPGALVILAELHARAGYTLPFRVLYLHDSIMNASAKTGRSLEQAIWSGLWTLQDDRRRAVFTIAGAQMIHADMVGTVDETSAERLRAECHVLAAEELIPSLEDAGGISERKYELGLTSMRLPSRRHVAVSTTNPGDKQTWAWKRWIENGGRPGCVRMQVPASDRLTELDVARLRSAFRDSPDLEARLARGEWTELVLGELVAVGFHDNHITPRIECNAGAPLLMGHDAGYTPCSVVAQQGAGGGLNILACLTSTNASIRTHLESLVLPWLAVKAPWGPQIISYYDPAFVYDQVDVLQGVLGGVCYPGGVSWPSRRDPLLTFLTRLNGATGTPAFQVSAEGMGCDLLISALRSRWHYPMVQGAVSRELPVKSHPWSDIGDALCYLVGGAAPRDERWHSREPIKVEYAFDTRTLFSPM